MKKKLLVFAVFMAALVISTSAQKKDVNRKKNVVLEYSDELNLSAEQIEKIKKIQSENSEKNRNLKEKQKQIAEEIRDNNAEMKNKIKDVLTPEQFEKLKTVIKDSIQHKREERKKAAKEIKDYTDKNIKPVIGAKRVEFDKLLSDEEKKTIAEYVAKQKALKDSRFKDSDPEMMKERRKSLHKETAIALKPILEKHKSDLEKILGELKPQFEKWQKDIKDIKDKNGNSEFDKKGEGKHKQEFNKKNVAIKFLLFDVEE